jgi:metal-responsive CopG/Arc/MetJ family transcriptional regulator
MWAKHHIIVFYTSSMAAKPVQISLDSKLLERIDRDPETRAEGRSAFVRNAVERYLATKRRREIDTQIVAAYRGQTAAALSEIQDLVDAQVWPDD